MFTIFCFYMGSPVVLKAGLLRYTLLYLETPFSDSPLPAEFFSCSWEFLSGNECLFGVVVSLVPGAVSGSEKVLDTCVE